MMSFSTGFLLSLSLCLDIGIANIAMITLAMQRGYFQGFWLGVGTCVGDLIYAGSGAGWHGGVAAVRGRTVDHLDRWWCFAGGVYHQNAAVRLS